MTSPQQKTDRAEPDSLVGLVPVQWNDDELDILQQVHPDVWAEQLSIVDSDVESATASIVIGDCPAPVSVHIDEALPKLPELAGTSKRPFRASDLARLKEHTAIWRLTMPDVSEDPLHRAHAYARLISTAVEAGAPGVFFPFCLQMHAPTLIQQLAVDFSKPPAMVNMYVDAWNNDDWMITRGLTVFGFPEIETPIDSGLNEVYFRLMDIAAGMLLQRGAYHDGARLEMGPRTYRVERGPAGPEDTMVPICGAFGRLTVRPEQ